MKVLLIIYISIVLISLHAHAAPFASDTIIIDVVKSNDGPNLVLTSGQDLSITLQSSNSCSVKLQSDAKNENFAELPRIRMNAGELNTIYLGMMTVPGLYKLVSTGNLGYDTATMFTKPIQSDEPLWFIHSVLLGKGFRGTYWILGNPLPAKIDSFHYYYCYAPSPHLDTSRKSVLNTTPLRQNASVRFFSGTLIDSMTNANLDTLRAFLKASAQRQADTLNEGGTYQFAFYLDKGQQLSLLVHNDKYDSIASSRCKGFLKDIISFLGDSVHNTVAPGVDTSSAPLISSAVKDDLRTRLDHAFNTDSCNYFHRQDSVSIREMLRIYQPLQPAGEPVIYIDIQKQLTGDRLVLVASIPGRKKRTAIQ